MNKHTAMKDFIQGFLTDRNLYFESIDNYPGFRSIVPEIGEYKVFSDVLGNDYKRYTFAFVGIENLDYGTSHKNEYNRQLFDDFADWILLQEKNGNYPNFGQGVSEYEWEVLENMANLADYNESTRTAKYMLSCRLNYTERGK